MPCWECAVSLVDSDRSRVAEIGHATVMDPRRARRSGGYPSSDSLQTMRPGLPGCPFGSCQAVEQPQRDPWLPICCADRRTPRCIRHGVEVAGHGWNRDAGTGRGSAQAALTGYVYAAVVDPDTLLVNADRHLLSKHRFVTAAPRLKRRWRLRHLHWSIPGIPPEPIQERRLRSISRRLRAACLAQCG